ncbi:MAG: hypothetical protein ABIK92_01720 [Pseudomonadota bacterium]
MLQVRKIPLDILSIVLYCFSLIFPVFYTESVMDRWAGQIEPGPTWYGIGTLLLGWLPALRDPFHNIEYWSISWFANPLFFTAFVLIRKKRPACLPIALLGLLIALTSLLFRRIWNDKEPPSIIITCHGIGF